MHNLQIIIASMPTLLVYMLVFVATIACTFGVEWQLKYAAEYQPKPTSLKIVRSVASSNRYLLVVFTALAIFIPSLLAGLRADTVGGRCFSLCKTSL